jgi:hypothetical protein
MMVLAIYATSSKLNFHTVLLYTSIYTSICYKTIMCSDECKYIHVYRQAFGWNYINYFFFSFSFIVLQLLVHTYATKILFLRLCFRHAKLCIDKGKYTSYITIYLCICKGGIFYHNIKAVTMHAHTVH